MLFKSTKSLFCLTDLNEPFRLQKRLGLSCSSSGSSSTPPLLWFAVPIDTGGILLDSGPTLKLQMTFFVAVPALYGGLSLAAVAFAGVPVTVGESVSSFAIHT